MRLIARLMRSYRHWLYKDQGQGQDLDSALMAAMEHPNAAEYAACWEIYRYLPYAGGDGRRYLFYAGRRNYVQIQKPRLTVQAGEAAGGLTVYAAYRLAKAGWPAAIRPGIHYGDIRVVTQSRRMAFMLDPGLRQQPRRRRGTVYRINFNQLSWQAFRQALGMIAVCYPEKESCVLLLQQLKRIARGPSPAAQSANPPDKEAQAPLAGSRLQVNIGVINQATRREDTWL